MLTRFKKDSEKEVVESLLYPEGEPQCFILSVSGFERVFRAVQKHQKGATVDIILNGNWALVQFSGLCNHRIRILPDNCFHPLKGKLNLHTYIEKKDFKIADAVATFYGQETYITPWRFIWEEISVDGIPGTISLLIFGIVLTVVSKYSNSNEVLRTINDLVIAVTSIFFTIFMLFTASQNLSLTANLYSFKRGLTHRFLRIDKMVSYLAILSLVISFINRVLTESDILLNTIFG